MKSIILFIVLGMSLPGLAYELEAEPDSKLADLLARLVIVHEPVVFQEQGYMVKFYGHDFGGHCAEEQYCRSLVELLIVTTEIEDEGPLSNLYRLPKSHKWEVLG